METNKVKLIECPRDAMQGWKQFIATEKKVEYLNSLLRVGFHTIDFGSFVSAKAIPQMSDTHGVLKMLDLSATTSKLLAIVANVRGATDAIQYEQIHYLGFPLSVSETFQQRNTNASIADALARVAEIQNLCLKHNKHLVVYISMGFGNPYGDAYNPEIVFRYVAKLVTEGIQIISLADTVGVATAGDINALTSHLIKALPQIEIGVHLHSSAQAWREKVDAAYSAGCRRFDSALKGIGGCPMAGDKLVGNMATEWLLEYLSEKNAAPQLNENALQASIRLAEQIFV